jgi:putative oxidoreductase
MRLVGGIAFVARAAATLQSGPATVAAAAVLAIVAGLFLVAGLWTPIAGSLVAVIGIWFAVTHTEDPLASVLLATIGAALALVGPGAWSIAAVRLEAHRRPRPDEVAPHPFGTFFCSTESRRDSI